MLDQTQESTHTTEDALLYGRVSYNDRITEARNLKGQLDMCREFCVQRGYHIVAELKEDDRGASGASFELPELSTALDMAREGKYQVFVVREIDRLSRNLVKQLLVEAELKRHGVRVEYVLGDYPDTAEGRLNKHIRASIAEFEREQITVRMSRGRRLKIKSGSVLVSKRPPYGYRTVDKDGKWILLIDDLEAHIVRLIFLWFVTGDDEDGPLTIGDITRKLTAMGIPSPSDTNPLKGVKKRAYGEWNRQSVHRILQRKTYTGTWHFGKRNGRTERVNNPDNLIAVDVPQIIAPETWEAAQTRLDENRRNGTRPLKYEYLMRRRLTCGTCASALVGYPRLSRGNAFLYYACLATRSKLTYARKCDVKNFRADVVDNLIWEWIATHLSNPEALKESLSAYQVECEREVEPIRERISVIDQLLSENRNQRQRLLDLYLKGDFEMDILTDRKKRLETTIQGLERERDALADKLKKQTLSDERLQKILAFADRQSEKVELASRDFAIRRSMIEELDARATLVWENNEVVVYATCILGEETLRPASATTSGGSRRIVRTAWTFTAS